MRLVTLPFRKAVYSALQGIEYGGVTIEAFEEDVQETMTKQIAIVTVNNMQVKVWIILTNQGFNDNSSKQCRNDETSLQIQVKAEYPSGKGNSVIVESVMNLVVERLFDYRGLFKAIEMPFPFELWKMDMIGSRIMNYQDDDCRVWMMNFDILGHVSQYALPYSNSGFDYAFDFALA